MKNLKERLAKVEIEKLEARKEFTFYICYNPCYNPCKVPTCEVPTCPDHGGGEGGDNN